MSWEHELIRVYEQHKDDKDAGILPFYYNRQKAHISIVIGSDAELLNVVGLPKPGEDTPMPVVQRTSGIKPYPLMDKLKYVAGDLADLMETDGTDEEAEAEQKADWRTSHALYMEGLKDWNGSPYTDEAIDIVYRYLEKKTLVGDLLAQCVIKPSGNALKGADFANLMVRISVIGSDGEERKLWEDAVIAEKYKQYREAKDEQAGSGTEKGFCYVTGRYLPKATDFPSCVLKMHPHAKLISANDTYGLTFRGRFADKDQAMCISAEAVQKMDKALRYLVEKHSVTVGDVTFIIWQPGDDAAAESDMPEDDDLEFEDVAVRSYTMKQYSRLMRKILFGTGKIDGEEIRFGEKTMVMALSVLSKGRMSIAMYEEIDTSEFLRNIREWHERTRWYRYDYKRKMYTDYVLWPEMIIRYAFGMRDTASKKLEVNGGVMTRCIRELIDCEIHNKPVPNRYIKALMDRVEKPYAHKEYWKGIVETACGLLQAKYDHEETDMYIDEKNTDRSYLFGRLLAMYEYIETSTYSETDDKIPNAKRMWKAYVRCPAKTAGVLRERILPYLKKKTPASREYCEKQLTRIMEKFTEDSYTNSRLNDSYLLGYYKQRAEIYKAKERYLQTAGKELKTEEADHE